MRQRENVVSFCGNNRKEHFAIYLIAIKDTYL